MIETNIQEELADIFAAVQIHSPMAFSFRGEAPIQVGGQAHSAMGNVHAPLLAGLGGLLYSECYTRTRMLGAAPPPLNLAPSLMQANQTQDRWDPGWSIYHLGGDGRIAIQKGDRSRMAVIGEYASNKAPGMLPQTGDQVNLRVCPGSADMQQGFYFSFGATLSDQFDDCALVRFYFNVEAGGAAELLRAVSSRFNHYAVPYRFKTLSDAALYKRADAAVLYVAKRYFNIAAALLIDLHGRLAVPLRQQTPMFCRTLRPGIGMAEEPGTGESFGMNRCRLVAESIVDAWLGGAESVEARMNAVRKRFDAAGIALERPYLNARSVDMPAEAAFAGGVFA